jgi:PAS domain S-box-containing protein
MVNNDHELKKYKDHLDQLKRVQEAGKVGYWAVYVDNEFLEWSEETYKLFDIPFGKPVTYEDMLTYVHPDDKARVDEKWRLAIKNGEYAVVYRIISAKQKVRWIETFGDVLFDADDNFARALGIVRDITEQKEAEIKMEALAKFLKRSQKIGHLGSWTIKANSTFIEINEEARVMFVWSTEKHMSLDHWISSIHSDDRNRVWQTWSKATEGKGDYDIEYRIIVNNSTKWVKAVAELEFDSEGRFIQAVGIVKDITEQVTQQENLRIARDQAEVANKLKSQFLANMSHEIRTPLNGVIGFSELLMKTSLDETQEHYMKTLNQSAHNLIGIINNILDFSKIEAGKLELSEEKADLLELINYSKNIISYQAQEKNIDLWVKIASNVPRYVIADGFRLQQVLVNLMSNAVKFTNEGEIELSVGLLKTKAQTSNTFRFSIRDTGIGISTENQSKIFDAFAQEDLSTTRKFGGTGLGLSISNGILALMDSHIQLESEIGKGSRFYFDVFLKPFQEDPDNLNISSNSLELREDLLIDKDLKSLVIKILVVEDNQVNMLLAQALIRSLLPKATILKALDGKMAVEIFENERPDLILMDIQMPVLNGLDATRRIREIESTLMSSQEGYQRTPIIAITAGILKEEKEKSLAAGMDDFLAKPIINEMFISSIKRWVFH